MDLKRLDRDDLTHEYGVESQRLLPWAVLDAPFEGAYCVVRPGGASTPHAHHEGELFVALAGEAVLCSDGRRERFRAGDVAHFAPGTEHQVVNEGDGDFEMFSVWWDLAMSTQFARRSQADALAVEPAR